MAIAEVVLRRVDLPLTTPYRLSYRTFESFEPILVEIRDGDGRVGWGEQHISPGSSAETREGGWAFAQELAVELIGRNVDEAIALVDAMSERSKVAATALLTALEMLLRPETLTTASETRLPLLTPFNAIDPGAIAEEVEERLEQGFKTFKIKVGLEVASDLERVGHIQAATRGRATLRLDANRAFSRDEGIAFASALDPEGIALFEQPCAAEDWEANGAVAQMSRVPLMLDEPICALPDIDRAAEMPGVGLCKVKLKRFGSLKGLGVAIEHIHGHGLAAVLGDGLGSEINCWMEACIARALIDNAGEFNGYLKVRPEARLLETPLAFEHGDLVIPAGFWPELDRRRLVDHTLEMVRTAPTRV